MSTLAEDLSDDGDSDKFALGSASISNDDIDESNDTEMADDDGALELVHVDQDFFYMAHVMRLAAMLHSLVSLAMLIAYYHLKVPLAIFKREKEIARRLEFDGLYIVEQPEDDDIKSHWDKLVVSAKCVSRFPCFVFEWINNIQSIIVDHFRSITGTSLQRKKFVKSIVKRTILIL